MKIKESGIVLFLEHYEENVKFYTEKMGLPIRESKGGLSKLEFGGSYLMVEDGGASCTTEKSRAQNPTVLRLDVEDFDETVLELEQRGISVEVLKFTWGIIGVVIDPEGNRIEIKD